MKKILIVIPMRGGSQGIPKKNLRLMNGKPLLFYSIRTALSLKDSYDIDVVVDTDDEEISEISKQYGAEIVIRPSELSEKTVTLDPVIYHATCEMEKRKNISYNIVITMQATSPTLKTDTIMGALTVFMENGYDTIISGVNDPHLSWTVKDGVAMPNYLKRLNRQQLPKHLRETGGFLITKRSCITDETRIGKNVTIYEVQQKEAIDIDTEADWELCESILKSKRIILRADGEESLGMGHIYRVLSLAEHLIGNEILFVTKKKYKLGAEKLKASFFKTKFIEKNDDIFKIIQDFKPNIVINDILNTKKEYIKRMKDSVERVISFEDRGEGSHFADVVINALYEGVPEKNEYVGFEYFFIRNEFLTVKPKEFSEEVKNIVVMFGGCDPCDLTRKMYKILQNISKKHPYVNFHIITGYGYKYKKMVCNDEENHIYVHNDVKLVSRYLADADIAITSQGRTIFELACMGVPSIVLAENQREVEHVFARFANGFINLGLGTSQESDMIQSTINWLIETPNVRRQMHELLLEKDFFSGQARVINLILGEKGK